MALFKLFDRRANPLENPARPLTDSSLLELLGGHRTAAGVNVNERNAMRMSGVWRAVTLISGLAGSLPLHVYDSRTQQKVANQLLDNVHPEMTNLEVWRFLSASTCLWGNGYAQKIRNGVNNVTYLYPLMPSRVSVGRAKPIPENPTGKVFRVQLDSGESVPLTPREIMHVPGLSYDGICGISPVRAAAQAIGTALAAEKASATLFGSGNLLSGLLQTDQRLSQEDAETLQERWRQKMAGADLAHSVAVLDSGATFKSLTMPSDEAQMLETRDFQITEVARFFGIPPYLMFQTERSTSWGTGLEQQATGFVQFDLHPQWLAPIEARITKELLPNHKYVKYNLNALMRGDSQARAEFYRTMREIGVFNGDDIRSLEDFPAMPDGLGQIFLQPMNMMPLGSDPAAAGESSPSDVHLAE